METFYRRRPLTPEFRMSYFVELPSTKKKKRYTNNVNLLHLLEYSIIGFICILLGECHSYSNNPIHNFNSHFIHSSSSSMFVGNTSRRFLLWKNQQLRQQQQKSQRRFLISFHLQPSKRVYPFLSSSPTLLWNSYHNHHNDIKTKEELLENRKKVEMEFQEWNDGIYCNLKSPQQVAKALNISSTSKEVLQELMMIEKTQQKPIGRTTNMAQLVLQHRQIQSQIIQYDKMNKNNKSRNHQQTVSTAQFFSTSNSTIEHDKINNNSHHNQGDKKENMPKILTNSPRSIVANNDTNASLKNSNNINIADSFFLSDPTSKSEATLSGNKVSPFWYDILRKISKPAAKSMLEQLNPDICPMGYDPLASPLDSTSSSSSRKALSATTTTTTAGKKGSLLHYVRSQKYKYPECVILMRVGEFYEAFGLDAICLVEYCGLNPMGGKARAGCPLKNIQSTLDNLTNAGFRIAVYEEATDTDASTIKATGGAKSRLKTRMLAQIVSPASPTYLYDLVLTSSPSSSSNILARPHVGIISTAAGYTIVEVSSEEQAVRVSERVTAEAVACRLAAYPPADPLIYVPSGGEDNPISSTNLPFLPSRSNYYSNHDGSSSSQGYQLKILPSFFQPTTITSSTDKNNQTDNLSYVDQAKKCIVSALLENHEFAQASSLSTKLKRKGQGDNTKQTMKNSILTHDDFTIVSSSSSNDDMGGSAGKCEARPLHMESATQLGLMMDPTIPSLVKYLLPDSAPAPTRRFLRRWLLTPPPPNIADSMSSLVSTLKDDGPALPPLTVPPVGKVLSLVRAGQASALVFRELLASLYSTVSIVDLELVDQRHKHGLVKPLMNLLRFESGMAADPSTLRQRCLESIKIIVKVINAPNQNTHYSNDDDESMSINNNCIDQVSQFDDIIPNAFFERNEISWRGRIKPSAAKEAYQKVDEAANDLAIAVAKDFWGGEKIFVQHDPQNDTEHVKILNAKEIKNPIVQDVFNNLFAIKEIPAWVKDNHDDEKKKGSKVNHVYPKYFHPRDRNGKILRNRYTSDHVDNALSNYIEACENASNKVKQVLIDLSETLCDSGHLPSLVQAAHTNLILSTASHHAASSNALGWNMATLLDEDHHQKIKDDKVDKETENIAGYFHELWPYWLDRSQAVVNTFDLNGLFLLTAPNMSGKSTLMRSTSAAALLTNCGLCAPLSSKSSVKRFDSIFVRGASSDVPTEDKSAFGAEMTDIAALMRTCGSRSLVFVDELGRGTSPTDGTSLAAAVLESMAEVGMSGIFATHLHGIIDIPFKLVAANRIKKKRMAINESSKNNVEWTYKLEDGVCTDSLALLTAARFGISESIINRASQFSSYVKTDSCKPFATSDSEMYISTSASSEEKSKVKLSPTLDEYSELEYISKILENSNSEKPKLIPMKWSSPCSLEGYSCVYVIQIDFVNIKNEIRKRFYVGETDKLSQRLRQHRSKGPEWALSKAIAVKVPGGKSNARNIESILIRKLIDAGYDLVSTVDGRTIRSVGSMNGEK